MLRTPIGMIFLTMYSREDLITLHEIFFREDYLVTKDRWNRLKVAVDFGANIGIASAYFLSRNENVRVYSYEPVKSNMYRAKRNLISFTGRVVLNECAVGLAEEMVDFNVEWSGRYSGIALSEPPVVQVTTIQVPCRRAESELERVLEAHEQIDVLKVDVEGMEKPILTSIDKNILSHIVSIYAECECAELKLPGFICDQKLSVASYYNMRAIMEDLRRGTMQVTNVYR